MTSVTDVAPVPATRTPEGAPRQARKPRGGVLLALLAWVIGILFVIPVLWMVLTSFHSEPDAATNPPSLAAALTLDGYREFFGVGTGTNPWPALLNSLTASIVSTVLVLLLAIPAAYALSIRPMDGAGLVRTLRQVVAPVVLPGIAATSLICFIFSWNELLLARVLTGTRAQTAPVYLTGFVTSQGLFLAQLCAAAFVVSLPVLIAGFAAQDKLVQGLSLGAVK